MLLKIALIFQNEQGLRNQKLKFNNSNIMNNLLLICLMLSVMSCASKKKQLHNFQMCCYRKIPQHLKYNNHRITFKQEWFLLKTCEEFSNDTIASASINGTEDILHYSKAELITDTLLFYYMKFSKSKNLMIDEKYITDNDVKIEITDVRGDSIFCLNNDTLLLIKRTQH